MATSVAGWMSSPGPDGQGNTAPFPFIVIWTGGWTIGTLALVVTVLKSWRAVLRGTKGPAGGLGGTIGMTLFSVPFMLGEVFGLYLLFTATSLPMVLVLVVLAGINLAFFHLMKAYTPAGRKLMDAIEGFRMYLDTAEEDRLSTVRKPEMTVELFERYLPYALALNLENRWAEQFSDVLSAAMLEDREYAPGWYHGHAGRDLRPDAFASNLGRSMSSAIASSTVAPGSRSGFSGGGGGGGSSGGGGGGGGGGGW